MINMEEINDEIARLEHGSTTYSACEKLSVLYAVRDKFGNDSTGKAERSMPKTERMYYSEAPGPESEFMEAVRGAPMDGVLAILDEHMEALSLVYPKEFAMVIRKIREL